MISNKNSREAIIHMLNVSTSTHLFTDASSNALADSLELDVPVILFGGSSQLGNESPVFLPEEATEAERKAEMNLPAFYLHTSGSTGHPKLIGQVNIKLQNSYLTH